MDEKLAKLAIKAAKHGNCAALTNCCWPTHGWFKHATQMVHTVALRLLEGPPGGSELLLTRGADPNAHNENEHWGTTPLHAAAHANHKDIVRLLLEHGADGDTKDMNGRTPLQHTDFHKATAAARVLQEFKTSG